MKTLSIEPEMDAQDRDELQEMRRQIVALAARIADLEAYIDEVANDMLDRTGCIAVVA